MALLTVACAWAVTAARGTIVALWRLCRTAGHGADRIVSTAGRVLTGPVRRTLAGPVRTGLVGRRAEVSLLAVLLAPVLATVTAWWVGTTVGYATLEGWVRGTWTGADPQFAVFLGLAALLAVGTASAAVNSGLVPTTALAAAPVFGAAVTRYGTTVTYSWGTAVVSLPDAVGVAAVLALAFGVPLGVASFLLGAALRRVSRVFGDDGGPTSRPERV